MNKTNIMKITFILAISVLGIALVGCTEKQENQEIEIVEKIEPAELQVQLDSLLENRIIAWDTMMLQDDLKMSSIKRLIQELSFIDGSKEDSIIMLDSLYDFTKNIRYTMDNVSNEKIDTYDNVQAVLLKRILGYAEIIPELNNYPMVPELHADVMKMDGQVVFMRAGYDNFALEFNNLLTNFPNTLRKLKPKYSTLKPVGVFTIVNDVDETELDESEEPAS